jgi:hypothetical protein
LVKTKVTRENSGHLGIIEILLVPDRPESWIDLLIFVTGYSDNLEPNIADRTRLHVNWLIKRQKEWRRIRDIREIDIRYIGQHP